MVELISLEDVLGKLYLDHKDVTYIDKNAAAERIKKMPSIDIVRCGECKFSARYVDDGHIECRLYSHPLRHDYHEMKPDDFCSYGERKESE